MDSWKPSFFFLVYFFLTYCDLLVPACVTKMASSVIDEFHRNARKVQMFLFFFVQKRQMVSNEYRNSGSVRLQIISSFFAGFLQENYFFFICIKRLDNKSQQSFLEKAYVELNFYRQNLDKPHIALNIKR